MLAGLTLTLSGEGDRHLLPETMTEEEEEEEKAVTETETEEATEEETATTEIEGAAGGSATTRLPGIVEAGIEMVAVADMEDSVAIGTEEIAEDLREEVIVIVIEAMSARLRKRDQSCS